MSSPGGSSPSVLGIPFSSHDSDEKTLRAWEVLCLPQSQPEDQQREISPGVADTLRKHSSSSQMKINHDASCSSTIVPRKRRTGPSNKRKTQQKKPTVIHTQAKTDHPGRSLPIISVAPEYHTLVSVSSAAADPAVKTYEQMKDKKKTNGPKKTKRRSSPERVTPFTSKITLQRTRCKHCKNPWGIKPSSSTNDHLSQSALPRSWLNHLSIDADDYSCKFCKKSCSSELILREHVSRHLLVQCLLCGLFFNEIDLFQAHMERIHSKPGASSQQPNNSVGESPVKEPKFPPLCRTKQPKPRRTFKKSESTRRISKKEVDLLMSEEYVFTLKSSVLKDQPETGKRITRSTSNFQKAGLSNPTPEANIISPDRTEHCLLDGFELLQSPLELNTSTAYSLREVDSTDVRIHKCNRSLKAMSSNGLKSDNSFVPNTVVCPKENNGLLAKIDAKPSYESNELQNVEIQMNRHSRSPCNGGHQPDSNRKDQVVKVKSCHQEEVIEHSCSFDHQTEVPTQFREDSVITEQIAGPVSEHLPHGQVLIPQNQMDDVESGHQEEAVKEPCTLVRQNKVLGTPDQVREDSSNIAAPPVSQAMLPEVDCFHPDLLIEEPCSPDHNIALGASNLARAKYTEGPPAGEHLQQALISLDQVDYDVTSFNDDMFESHLLDECESNLHPSLHILTTMTQPNQSKSPERLEVTMPMPVSLVSPKTHSTLGFQGHQPAVSLSQSPPCQIEICEVPKPAVIRSHNNEPCSSRKRPRTILSDDTEQPEMIPKPRIVIKEGSGQIDQYVTEPRKKAVKKSKFVSKTSIEVSNFLAASSKVSNTASSRYEYGSGQSDEDFTKPQKITKNTSSESISKSPEEFLSSGLLSPGAESDTSTISLGPSFDLV